MNMEQFVLSKYHYKRFDQYSDIFLISYDENNSQEKIIFRIWQNAEILNVDFIPIPSKLLCTCNLWLKFSNYINSSVK